MPDDSVLTTGRINAIESIECTFQELRNGATFVYREIDCCLLNKLYRGHDAIEIFIRLHSIFHLFTRDDDDNISDIVESYKSIECRMY